MLKFSLTSALVFLTTALFSQESANIQVPKRVYTTNSVENKKSPVIDGYLTDAAWNNVEWQGDFVEWRPDENTSPTQPTKFKIVYDDKFLYVAFKCYDADLDKIEKRLSRRDGFQGDWVEINIDSYNDKRTAFSFTFTVAGVKGDEFISENGSSWDSSWNPIWYGSSKLDDEGWTAELKIPFSQLKFGDAKEQVWGLQVKRRIFRAEERSIWQRIPLESSGYVSEFGELRGLLNIKPQKQLEIQPFVVNQYDSYPKEVGNPYRDGSDYKFNGGLDAKIGITNDLTLDLTVNPDFGQVEADPGAIALDGFQIFFREQRPFFIENKNIFDYEFGSGQDNLFYSRRIGRNPHGRPSLEDGEYADVPKNTTILGAAKFSGKTKSGWSLGLLESVTGKMYAEIDANGEKRDELVEPLTNYLVARAQKDFNNRNSYVGAIFTSTNRRLEDDLDFLRKSAVSAGVDFKHNWKNREYYVEGNFVASSVRGSKEAITNTQKSITHLFNRVDAGHVRLDTSRTSLSGSGGKLEFGKAGGGNWRYEGGVLWYSPELELNDIGFLRQADKITQFAEVQRLFLKPTDFYRNIRLQLGQYSTFDFDGNYNIMSYQFNGNISYKNNWWTEVEATYNPVFYSNANLRGGPRWRYAKEGGLALFAGSDNRKKFYSTVGYVGNRGAEDTFSYNRYVFRFTYQPVDAFSLSMDNEFSTEKSKTQYVTQRTVNNITRYILGEIDQNTFSSSIRLNYNLNPNLSLQYYGQPFISRGTYTNFNYVNNPIASSIDDRITLYGVNQIALENGMYIVDEDANGIADYEFGDPDFSFVQFRSNLVLRWEYIPGSEIFLVWSQGLTSNANPDDALGRSLNRQILDRKKDNTILLKATYRFIL
ncbi:DUF5916 domain-containing protein [Cellulophaga lytica]|uniref:Putative membrane associated hydrolase n=1 Tax=Cellulophaga lytica (strain ATCC 23178 / DSM 7489 / JCM 8516 / NBRC 14961 / NCIMB 1423 / VKM B-1433 / Cy l20) TaxID=867900 RepID=F0RC31_CELLC|nr:DUF5916 domain-containing protein [Cellulophaga lytica]ADY29665.1 putative membrane associated hydrolase [Cellulophaga lytica DSM 7489]WQG76163.1 DUF5916 domain-containing protein [Cellulophaga lytica]